ncbi:unnamed protein product [Oikopleura dioica]|uniref:Protein FAM136A n=1 Tax=Oikopleura dioica TaxID=34765 RepID=E4WVM0_OIKDI|nr:unnamed protein product [Oikopleura dioica]CBY21173.1 unnamed protein product [Oikopleura dioica]
MATPEGFVKVQEKMQALQEKVESGLRPALAKQFRSMADCMDQGGSTQQIESCVQSAQTQVVGLQKQMDEVVQSFGMAIQTGMQNCQAKAQQAMSSGTAESAAQADYMKCANEVAISQLSTFPALEEKVNYILRGVPQ